MTRQPLILSTTCSPQILKCFGICLLFLVSTFLQAQVKDSIAAKADTGLQAGFSDSTGTTVKSSVKDTSYNTAPVSKVPYAKELTIVYNIAVKSKNKKAGVEETYNGGLKTIFLQGNKTRIRMVTLMRIQSLFFVPQKKPGRAVLLLKEFGKEKYKTYLDSSNWLSLNEKYDSITCEPASDTEMILNHPCKKMLLHLTGGKTITVLYTDSIRIHNEFAEPIFKCVPGLVLKYEYTTKRGTLAYTASEIKAKKIDPSVFVIPQKGYAEKKYCYQCEVKEVDTKEQEEPDL